MSGKREQKSERARKPDKMMSESHREFLDLDTDEEDFGRQESPEIEEELPPEPEKPVFSEQDLVTLVEYVKSFVVLPSLKDSDWNENCHEIIREFFCNPSHSILCVFYRGNKLAASLSLPDYAPTGLTYFSRSPWQIYTAENFLSTVSFGNINENVQSSVLKFMENIYAPVALNSDDYPPLMRNDLFLSLHDFLIRLTEEVYKPMGLTILYVPKEHLLQTFLEPSNKIDCYLLGEDKGTILAEEDEKKQKLVGRLEKILWWWIRQIREMTKSTSVRKNVRNILDEVNYWKARHSNLNYLNNQLFDPDVRLITDILTNFRSASVESFQKLITRVQAGLAEASSNLMYLNVLSDSCKNLNLPDETDDSVTRVLLLILFVWTESPFYNTTNNIETLCRALSSQIIHECKKYIQLDVALGSNPEDGIQMLKKCILCCDTYKAIYRRVTTNVAERVNCRKEWDINEGEVFDKIDVFKQRCYDVIEICKALIVFGRCNKVGLLGSPKGMEYEKYCRKIENLFYESLNEIVMIRDTIFDVARSGWIKKIGKFRDTVLHLENMVKNLINDIFEDVKNIEEGIEAIYALHKFNQRQCLREILQNKWTQVWKIFYGEVEYCYIVINETGKYDRSMQYDDAAENMLCIMQYLKTQYTIMTNASDWIGACAAEKSISQQYKRVLSAIDERRKMCESYST